MNLSTMEIISILQNSHPSAVMGISLTEENCMPIALNTFKTELLHLKDRSKTSLLQIYMDEKRKVLNKTFAAGGYLEDRSWYARSPLFGSERSVHLGIDIWADAGHSVHSPYDGTIHSFADNVGFGNYGPTLVLEHKIEGMTFYTLYGHLARASMALWEQGKTVLAGQQIGVLGEIQENGEWPAHLHFQVITDLQGKEGDFPGVCVKEDVKYYKNICPDPNLVLRIPGL